MACSEKPGCLCRVGKFVVFERIAIAYGVSWPGTALFVH
jgi:hypothetical protein